MKNTLIIDYFFRAFFTVNFLIFISLPSFAAQKNGANNCMVSEFKMIAYMIGSPSEREEKAKKWLLNAGQKCNQTQLKIIQSSAPSWLGTSLSHELSVILENLQEAKLNGDATKLLELYMPAIKTFEPSVERSVNPQARAPLVANVAGGVVMGGVVAINNNIENEEDDEKRRIPNQKFSPESRGLISRFFDELRGDKECPPFMKPQGEMCVTVRPNRTWKLGEPLDGQSMITDIPLKLRERLGAPPRGHKFIQINEDILLVNEKNNVVADMVLDFGGVSVKKTPPTPDPKPKK